MHHPAQSTLAVQDKGNDAHSALIRQMRRIVGDCFQRQPWIYWTDLLLTVTIGYSAAAIYLAPGFSWLQLGALVVAGLALFRAGTFIHEIAHMGKDTMRSFQVGWNLLCGVPMLMPSFLYDCHIDHHAVPHYGTGRDGEYLPLGAGPVARIFWYLAQILVIPLLAVIRFLVLTPISFLHPRLRRWVLERFSSYVMNPRYRRQLPPSAPKRWWAWLEGLCFLRVAAMLGVVALGVYPWTRLLSLYVLACYVIGLNWVRNLVAHTYRNTGEPMSHLEQLTDSITLEGMPLVTELFFPLGLRYHALHHLFPGIPYHNLARAHYRLMEQLPPDSPYHQTVRPGFWAALAELWHNARSSSARPEGVPSRQAA